MRQLTASIGAKHNARIVKTWHGSFEQFCKSLLSKVPETDDKASNGWVCGAVFNPQYRDSENFVARHFLSFDYDHVAAGDVADIFKTLGRYAYLAYTTFSHTHSNPRYRFWLPLSRECGYDEFQAVSRAVGSQAGIERLARESHVPSQFMYRPAVKPFEEFQSWVHEEAPWVNVDEVLATYANWTDRSQWPHRAEGDGVHSEGASVDPRTKTGLVGAFCRAFTISEAIEKFELPYTPGSSEGRLTYTDGSRPDGAIIYDDDTKLHSHHDTDPARGQNNAYDLVRLHRFGWLDNDMGGTRPLAERSSSRAMHDCALQQESVAKKFVTDEGFADLDATDTEWLDEAEPTVEAVHPLVGLPDRIVAASSKLTDQENARRIQRKYNDRLLSVGDAFFCWSGTHWEKGGAQALRWISYLSQTVRAEAKKAQDTLDAEVKRTGIPATEEDEAAVGRIWQWAVECGQKSRISNCETLLRSFLDFDAKHLNAAPHLFSCASGTIDLRTGESRAHSPKDFITACSPIAFDPTAEAPRFKQFLVEIYDGNADVADFAKRWFGYCLTGSIDEHKMVFHIGRGGNGKGTLMDLLSYVLGPGYYSTTSQKLLSLDETGATPELAGLLGRRMVTIGETEENLEIREGLIKSITGGDTISARHLFKAPFEFRPTHKLQVFTNHAPAVKSQDFAMWRRIILLNYPVSYGDAVEVAKGDASRLKDPHLEAALKAEAPGVLRWLVEGARDWYEGRLQPPASVLEDTNRYREDQDVIGQFAKARLIADSTSRVALSGVAESLFPAYRGWCSSVNCRPLGRTRFMREILRVMPRAKPITWRDGNTPIVGFSGIKLTDSLLDD